MRQRNEKYISVLFVQAQHTLHMAVTVDTSEKSIKLEEKVKHWIQQSSNRSLQICNKNLKSNVLMI